MNLTAPEDMDTSSSEDEIDGSLEARSPGETGDVKDTKLGEQLAQQQSRNEIGNIEGECVTVSLIDFY